MATETWELKVSGYAGPENNTCVMHFNSDNVAVSDTAHDGYQLIDSWVANIMTSWRALFPGTYFMDSLQARRVLPKFSAVAHKQFPFRGTAGTHAGLFVSSQLCPVVKLIPPLGVKSAGKVFLPCAPVAAINDNAYQAAWVTKVVTCFNLMKADFGTGSLHWQQAIYSRKLGSASLVLDFGLSPLFGFQKRRRQPVG